MSTPDDRWVRQLRRVETLSDVVFGVILVRIFALLPRPDADSQTIHDMLDFFVGNVGAFVPILIGFVISIIYWLQSNATLGLLRRTDTRHTVTALIQLVALLVFMHAIFMGIQFDGDTFAMVWEGFTAAVAGFIGWINWAYATKDSKLLHTWVTEEEVRKRSLRLIPEPVTAVLTIPCAFLGPAVWGLSWFVIGPIVGRVTKRRLAS